MDRLIRYARRASKRQKLAKIKITACVPYKKVPRRKEITDATTFHIGKDLAPVYA